MKKNIILWSIFLFLGFSSCEKYIDETRSWGTIPIESAFKDPVLVEYYVNNFYDFMPNGSPRTTYYSEEGCGAAGSILDVLAGTVDGGAFKNNDGNLYDWVEDRRMPNAWAQIRSINEFLANIDQAEAEFELNQKNWFKGQAFFFRAYIYYQFVELFGGVPIITEVQDALAPAEELNVARNSSLECFNFIEEQLDSAIHLLPARGTKDYDAHRVDKVTALALKSKALVLKASPRFCNTKVDEYWQDAYNTVIAAKAEADAEGFGLYHSYKNMWLDKEAARNIEFLFYVPYEYGLRTDGNRYKAFRPGSAGTEGNRWNPSWNHVQAYPMANGKNIEDAGSGYDEEIFWANRDPRFYVNVAYTGAPYEFPDYPGRRQITFFGCAPPNGDGTNRNVTGFQYRKEIDQSLTAAQVNEAGADVALIRYAELLLWHAECANEVNKSSEAFDQLVLIRERAGIEPGTDGRYGLKPGVGTDYQATLDAIMKERQIELAFEGQRWWDYCRRNNLQALRDMEMFDTYIPRLDVDAFNAMQFRKRGTSQIINITGGIPWTDVVNALTDSLNNAPSITIENQIIKAVTNYVKEPYDSQSEIALTDAYLFAPVYQGDINKSPALEQNIGWPGGTFDPRITQ